jgi:hypothetical protein
MMSQAISPQHTLAASAREASAGSSRAAGMSERDDTGREPPRPDPSGWFRHRVAHQRYEADPKDDVRQEVDGETAAECYGRNRLERFFDVLDGLL